MNKIRKIIILTMAMIFVLISSVLVYAETTDDNGTGGGLGEGAGYFIYGASGTSWGYRVYIVDDEGVLQTSVVDIIHGYFDSSVHVIYKDTRLGNGSLAKIEDIKVIPDTLSIPAPYLFTDDDEFVGNGIALRDWMRELDTTDRQNILNVVEHALGQDALDLFISDEKVYLVLEPITWHGLFSTFEANSYIGIRFYGTFYNYMQLYNDLGMAHGGFTSPVDNNVLGRCLALDRDQENLGLVVPYTTGIFDYNNLSNQGAGIHLYASEDFIETPEEIEITVKESQIIKDADFESSLTNEDYPNNIAFDGGVHRGNDLLTVAKFKNTNSVISSLSGFTEADDKTTNTRKTADYTEVVEHITINYETYSGKSSLSSVTSGIIFRPYIKMRYDTETTKDNTVYVLGEYERILEIQEGAEVLFTKSSKPNLSLDSVQWSTHAEATLDKGSQMVLPGGATLNMSISENDRQTIEVISYAVVFDGNGKTQVEKTSDSDISSYTKENAEKAHNNYVDSVIDGLEGMKVVQWINKNDSQKAFSGSKVTSGSSLVFLGNNCNKASEDDKYYFDGEVGDADSCRIDYKEQETEVEYYTFSSDTEGNILMNGSVILDKTQGVNSLTGVAKRINSKTKVVTNLIAAIERNSGDDTECPWAEDGKWYNEAFDGITIAVSTTEILTGFINPYDRTSVFDPLLTPKSSGKGDMFSKYFICAFKMEDFSDTYRVKNQIGIYKNKPVYMSNMDMLYYSKEFFTSNITVQDLR